MGTLAWDETLETGDTLVDGQHRELLGMFNELHEAAVRDRGPLAIGEILERLEAYVAEHFEAERRFMLRIGYPADAMAQHLTQHDALTSKTVEMIRAHRAGELTTVLPLALFLQEWLGDHIRKSDRAFVAFSRAAGRSL